MTAPSRRRQRQAIPQSSRFVLTGLALAILLLTVMQFFVHEADDGAGAGHSKAMLVIEKADFVAPRRQQPNKGEKDDGAAGVVSPSSASKVGQQRQKLPGYHVVFSTSCGPQMDWESLLFFYHAMKVNQPGNVTRIASGCSDKQIKDLAKFHRDYISPMSDNFHVHFTPNYSKIHLTKEGNHSYKSSYKYMNKPYGLRHWMEEGLGMSVNRTVPGLEDDIIILMDPDMVLLRPLLHDFRNEKVIWVEDDLKPEDMVVRHGHPIGQQDGYLTNEWMKLPLEFEQPVWKDGPKHWNSGPPYLATVKDFYNIAVLWTEMAPQVLKVYPKLFAEMFGLIISTVHLKLPFTFVKSIVVSTTTTDSREGWKYIDALPDDAVCDPTASSPSSPLPIALHYCSRYLLGKWFYGKYRLKHNLLRCEKSLLRPVPHDIFPKYNYSIQPPRADLSDMDKENVEPMSRKRAKREAFMLCHMVSATNEALRYHKRRACGEQANLNETYTVHEDPSSW